LDLRFITRLVGVVYNELGQVLVGQRVVKDLYFKKWEFPGGKVEKGETTEAALRREFIEEVGIELGPCTFLMLVEHDYPDRKVRLHVHTVRSFSGTIQPLEGQALKWVGMKELAELDFIMP